MIDNNINIIRTRLMAPRSGAIAGIVFSVLFIISLVIIRLTIPANPQDAGSWLSAGWKKVSMALNLLPFAGIAFLWFIGVLRDRLGEFEDRFFATVFLGSGLLFLAMIFAAAAVSSGTLMAYNTAPVRLMETGIYTFSRTVVYQFLNVYALKMAGVFMISTCTLSVRTGGIFPQWIAFLGYGLALLLLISIGFFVWISLVFPMWVMLISVYILFANFKPKAA